MELIDLDLFVEDMPIVTKKDMYGYCCGEKMLVESESKLLCIECGRIAKNLGEYGNKPESQKAQYTSFGGVLPGVNILKTDTEKINEIATEYIQKINHNGGICDLTLVRTAAGMMFQFSQGNTKKSQNRNQLFGACLFYSSVRHGNLLMDADISTLLNLKVKGISKGIGIISKYVVRHRVPFEFDPPLHKLAIKYYLKLITINNFCLDTKDNRRFCKKLVEEINRCGIGYDKGILVKCHSAVYYMLYHQGLHNKFKKKEITSMMKLSQHTYTPIFTLLKVRDINNMLSPDLRLNYS